MSSLSIQEQAAEDEKEALIQEFESALRTCTKRIRKLRASCSDEDIRHVVRARNEKGSVSAVTPTSPSLRACSGLNSIEWHSPLLVQTPCRPKSWSWSTWG